MERDWDKILNQIKKKGKRRKTLGNTVKTLVILILFVFTYFFTLLLIDSDKEKTIAKNTVYTDDVKLMILTENFYDDDFGFFINK